MSSIILSLSNIGYKVGRIGGLSCDVNLDEDADVDVDVDVDFEQSEGVFLQIVGTDTISSSTNLLYLKYVLILSWGIY